MKEMSLEWLLRKIKGKDFTLTVDDALFCFMIMNPADWGLKIIWGFHINITPTIDKLWVDRFDFGFEIVESRKEYKVR